MKLLIVKMSALGDIIHALPILDFLHRIDPSMTIDWAVEEAHRGVLEGNSHINRLHMVRTKQWRKRPFSRRTRIEIAELKRNLRAGGYELVLDIQGNLKSGVVSWLSGAPRRVGYGAEALQERGNLLFTTERVQPLSEDCHVTEQILRVVSEVFGRDFHGLDLVSEIPTRPEEDAAAAKLIADLGDGPKIVFHNGTTWNTKLWTIEGWIALGRAVTERHPEAAILLSWGTGPEKESAEAIAAGIGVAARVLPRFSLKSFTALLKQVDLVVGPDTGPVHISAAVGTPTVSFFRASDGRRNGPFGPRHVVVQSPLECSPCFLSTCPRDVECRETVMVDGLESQIENLLACSWTL